jgi:hypothetical protein
MTEKLVRRVVFASALYDLIVTWPFATPWTARWAMGPLADLHSSLGLAGVPSALGDPMTLLFANLMGSIVVVWSIVRLLTPTVRLGVADTAGRALFSAWMAFAIAHGASPLLAGFLALELAWGLVQGGAIAVAARRNEVAR